MFGSKDVFLSTGAGGYQISRSVRLRSSASAYLNRTLTTPTNNKIWTWSAWVKRGTLSTTQRIFFATGTDSIFFETGDTLAFYINSATSGEYHTTQVFRDPSAWYHLIIAVDTTQATNTNRVKFYVNGTQITSFSGGLTYPTQNSNTYINSAVSHALGAYGVPASQNYFDGYLADVNFIDGQQLTPSSFGATNTTTGVWGPTKYTGTYGNNGFYLNFSDNSSNTATTIGKDYSGNGNNWTPNNISVTAGATYDSMVDSPTNYGADTGAGGTVRGNYCVMNPVAKNSRITAANGNLQVTGDNTGTHQIIYGTFPMTTGKWYWEVVVNNPTTSTVNIVGIQSYIGFADGTYCASSGNGIGWGYTTNNGNFYSSNFTVSGTAPVLANGTIGIAYDADAGKIWFRNTSGSWVQGDPAAGTSPTGTLSGTATAVMPAVSFYNSNGAWSFNFGQQAFSYTAPSGYKALNTQNLPTPTIANGAGYMAATLYTGNDPSTQTLTNTVGTASFQPDLVWVKARSNAYTHVLVDSVRGVSKALFSNLTNAEVTEATRYVYAFNSNGFSVKEDTGTGSVNATSGTYVGWQWLAGAGSSSSNTNGSITSTVSVNTTAGFSVVTWTGTGANATVGHGLGVAPSFIIARRRDNVVNWYCYHSSLSAGNILLLNTTQAQTSVPTAFNSGTPTSTTFPLGADTTTNASGGSQLAYCFAPIVGYSAFGSYTGNGAADGPFVYLGFRPRYVMMKRTDNVGDWWIFDTSRDPYNVMTQDLFADTSAAEANNGATVDYLSNGFKLRLATYQPNTSGGTFVYAAFAENPFKFSLAR